MLLTSVSAGSNLETGLAQGYLVFNVVPTGTHSGPGQVWSNTAEEQGVRLEHTAFAAVVVGWEHQVPTRMLRGLAINTIAVGDKRGYPTWG